MDERTGAQENSKRIERCMKKRERKGSWIYSERKILESLTL